MNQSSRDLRHELLSELHRLLGIATAEDFRAASKLCKSENIKLALEALAEEHLSESREKKQPDFFPEDKPINIKKEPPIPPSLKPFSQIYVPNFETRNDLIRFIQMNEIDVKIDEKISKERLLQRLLKTLSLMSEDQRLGVFQKYPKNTNEQTEGWLNVIRKRKR